MHHRIPGIGIRALPFGGGANLLLLVGGVYFAAEHEKGRHEKPNLLCPICLLNKVVSPQRPSGGASSEQPPQSA